MKFRPPIQINSISRSEGYWFALAAVVSFHLAYGVPGCQWFMGVFLYCMFRLAELSPGNPADRVPYDSTFESRLAGLMSGSRAGCLGVVIGLAAYTPHLLFFWTLFGPGAIALWVVLSCWLGLFLFVGRAFLVRFGPIAWAVAAPFFWTGMEYFRSELYYLRFSWLNVGYAFSTSASLPYMAGFGVYGIGFLFMAWASFVGVAAKLSRFKRPAVGLALAAASSIPFWLATPDDLDVRALNVTGIQLEGSPPGQIKSALESALKKYPQTDLFVLSEYAFDGPVPPEILAWCKERGKWLAAGGKDQVSPTRFYDTVFVAGPDGSIVFRQAKCVPVQFMKDGLPAREQHLWDSPWGKLGFGVCYDASYTRVTDELIRQGAQALIFPTMDSAEWGKGEHKLHARIAPMRAEYLVPIFRLCSSGISQFVGVDGKVKSSAPFPGQDEMLTAQMELMTPGRMPLDRPLTQLAVVVTAVLMLFVFVDAWWAPRPPPPP